MTATLNFSTIIEFESLSSLGKRYLFDRLTERRKKNRLAEEQMSKRMLGLNVDNKKSVEKKKTGSGFLSNSQWITVGVIMGGAGVLLGGLLSWFKVHI
jgi:hypothetical protein